MIVHTAENALREIERQQENLKIRLDYAKRLIERRSRAVFIPDCVGHCSFAGQLLATVVDRNTEAAIYIQDADDWGIEQVVSDVKTAELIFDWLFLDIPYFTQDFEKFLRFHGFSSI